LVTDGVVYLSAICEGQLTEPPVTRRLSSPELSPNVLSAPLRFSCGQRLTSFVSCVLVWMILRSKSPRKLLGLHSILIIASQLGHALASTASQCRSCFPFLVYPRLVIIADSSRLGACCKSWRELPRAYQAGNAVGIPHGRNGYDIGHLGTP
jgi:hypothetical protein